MDLKVISTSGFPEDGVISIRAGSMRRQMATNVRKAMRFPKIGEEEDHLIKFDVMEKVGTGYLVMKPLEAGGTRYKVAMANKPDMTCEVEVSDAEGKASAAAAEEQDPAAAEQDAQAAQAYMD